MKKWGCRLLSCAVAYGRFLLGVVLCLSITLCWRLGVVCVCFCVVFVSSDICGFWRSCDVGGVI